MISQVIILCIASVAFAQYGYESSPTYGKEPAPYDHTYEKPQPYSFGYDIKDEYGATQNRKEEGDDYGNKRGSYGYTDGYGIYRQVDYVADKHGFRASVKTNEPGTENQDPADVQIHSEAAPVKYEVPRYKPSPAYNAAAYKAAVYPAEPEYSRPAPVYKPAPAYPAYPAPSYSPAPEYHADTYKAAPEYVAPAYETSY